MKVENFLIVADIDADFVIVDKDTGEIYAGSKIEALIDATIVMNMDIVEIKAPNNDYFLIIVDYYSKNSR